jgi:hypothetical protein
MERAIGWTLTPFLPRLDTLWNCKRKNVHLVFQVSCFTRSSRATVNYFDWGYVAQRVFRPSVVREFRQRNVDPTTSIVILTTAAAVTPCSDRGERCRSESIALARRILTKIMPWLAQRVEGASKEGKRGVFVAGYRHSLGILWTPPPTRPLKRRIMTCSIKRLGIRAGKY